MDLNNGSLELEPVEALYLGQTIVIAGEMTEDAFMVEVGKPVLEAGFLAGLLQQSTGSIPADKAEEYKAHGVEIVGQGEKVVITPEKTPVVGNFAFLAGLKSEEIIEHYKKPEFLDQEQAAKDRIVVTWLATALINGFFKED